MLRNALSLNKKQRIFEQVSYKKIVQCVHELMLFQFRIQMIYQDALIQTAFKIRIFPAHVRGYM